MHIIRPSPMISKRAAAEIRTAILNGSVPPGSHIHQEKFAAMLGVSREPVRKAVVQLEKEGLVNIVGRSALVAPIDPEFMIGIYGFREVIEGYIAATVAARKDFDPTTLRSILARGCQSVKTRSVGRLIELDQAFHNELYCASENKVVVEVMATQWSHIYRAMMTDLSMDSFRKQTWDEHRGIVDAISRRQVCRARMLASAHIRAALGRKEARSQTQRKAG